MNNEKQVNKIARNLGATLSRAGNKMIASAFHLQPKIYTKAQLSPFLLSKIKSVSLSDQKYHLISWEKWKEIIAVDWTDLLRYIPDTRDCDNFAAIFTSRMSEIFELNTAGICYGYIEWDNANGTVGKGGHAYNLIITEDYGELNLRLYEPMNDLWAMYNDNIQLGKFRYVASNWVLFI